MTIPFSIGLPLFMILSALFWYFWFKEDIDFINRCKHQTDLNTYGTTFVDGKEVKYIELKSEAK